VVPAVDRLPTGTVTFLFTDIEGSTRLLEAIGVRYTDVLARHHALIRAAVADRRGKVVGTEGDAFFLVFERAQDALQCAVDVQRALAAEPWPADSVVRVRIGGHTGVGTLGGDDYIGLDVHRAARIAAAAHGGQILVSEATRGLCEASLGPAIAFDDLGQHRLKDLSRPERLFQVVADGLERTFPAPRTLDPPTNLPAQLTSFVGRETEVAELRGLLDGGARLVTLTGPGGTGKTRLGLRVATSATDRYPDGVFFADLSMTSDPADVGPAIARSLRLVDQPGRSIEDALADHLRDRTLLLVIDNLEQVIESASLIADLLRAAPHVAIIATSRGPLRVAGEHEYAVPPLGLADDEGEDPATLTARAPAIALFVERAVAARPDFRLTDANATHVAAICARLDGLPLAIELAAARVRLLPPEAILARLEHSLDLLDRGGRDLPARQQTLRGAISWSHDLLEPPIRQLFARMSVFSGGARLEEIETVDVAAGSVGTDVLDGVAELADQSLLKQSEQHGEPRFTMLQTVREFAGEQLAASTEREAVRLAHAETYLALAERAAPELIGVDQRPWLDRLEHEHDNLRAAIAWSFEVADSERALRLVTAPWRFWHMRGHLIEARDAIDSAIAMPGAADHPVALARAHSAAGGIAYWLGDPASSRRHYRIALEIAQGLDDRRLLAEALTDGAMSADPDALLTPEGMAQAAEGAMAGLDEALSIYRDLGDRRGEAAALWTIGTARTFLDDLDGAESALDESVVLSRDSGDMFHAGWSTFMLGSIARQRGDVARASTLTRDALLLFTEVRDLTGMLLSLEQIRELLHDGHQSEIATRIAGALDAFERRHGSEYLSGTRQMDAAVDPRDEIGDDPRLIAAWEDGQATGIDEAVALALSAS
jgi:predicted ATPase/class 3 adenylate cyclase